MKKRGVLEGVANLTQTRQSSSSLLTKKIAYPWWSKTSGTKRSGKKKTRIIQIFFHKFGPKFCAFVPRLEHRQVGLWKIKTGLWEHSLYRPSVETISPTVSSTRVRKSNQFWFIFHRRVMHQELLHLGKTVDEALYEDMLERQNHLLETRRCRQMNATSRRLSMSHFSIREFWAQKVTQPPNHLNSEPVTFSFLKTEKYTQDEILELGQTRDHRHSVTVTFS